MRWFVLLLVLFFASCGSFFPRVFSSSPQAFSSPDVRPTSSAWTANVPSPNPMASSSSTSAFLQGWSLEQKIGQTMIVGFDGVTIDDELRQLITDYHIGGVILFARNIQSPQQVAQLTNDLQQLAWQSGHPGLFIAIDQEGGRVARLTEEKGFTEIPSAMALAATGSPHNAHQAASLLAEEMRAVGINVDFAPVLDVNNNPSNPIIGIRSFGSSPQQVRDYGIAFAKGLEEQGILAFGKHFPGHGDTSLDSHIDLPTIPHDRARLEQVELVPFRAFVANHLSGIMTAHITFPAIDPQEGMPATLSRAVLTGLLRQELGFSGLIVTDSLEMGALAQSGYPPEEGAPLALAAGADLLLFNRDHAMHRAAYRNLLRAVQDGKISLQQLDSSVTRILNAKQKFGILTPVTVQVEAAAQQVGTPAHRQVSRQLAAHSITLLRDPQGLLPLNAAPLIVEPEAVRGAGSQVYPGATIIETDSQPSASQIANVLRQASAHTVTLVFVHDLEQNTQQAKLLQELVQQDCRVLTVLHRSPFDSVFVPSNATVVITYGLNPPVRDVLPALLNGRLPFQGSLPVNLP